MSKNTDMPAMPQDDAIWCQRIGECPTLATGLTKREMFCLHAGVAETGDAELDAIIRKGNRQNVAMHMMGQLVPVYWDMVDDYESASALVKSMSESAIEHADALLAELEKTNE